MAEKEENSRWVLTRLEVQWYLSRTRVLNLTSYCCWVGYPYRDVQNKNVKFHFHHFSIYSLLKSCWNQHMCKHAQQKLEFNKIRKESGMAQPWSSNLLKQKTESWNHLKHNLKTTPITMETFVDYSYANLQQMTHTKFPS